jgi:hypothetical protein
MKKIRGYWGYALLVLAMVMASGPAQAAVFGLQDIPEIKNKAPLNTICETGQVWDKIMPYIEAFTKKTGIKVNVERVASPVVYSKENVELMGGTGYYDVLYVETAWTTEWSNLCSRSMSWLKIRPGGRGRPEEGSCFSIPLHSDLRPGVRRANGSTLLHLPRGHVYPPGCL